MGLQTEIEQALIDNLLCTIAGQGIAVYEYDAKKISPQILAKMREVVKEAELSDDEIKGIVFENGNAYVCEHGEVPTYEQYVRWGAEAQLQAILNAMDKEKSEEGERPQATHPRFGECWNAVRQALSRR